MHTDIAADRVDKQTAVYFKNQQIARCYTACGGLLDKRKCESTVEETGIRGPRLDHRKNETRLNSLGYRPRSKGSQRKSSGVGRGGTCIAGVSCLLFTQIQH